MNGEHMIGLVIPILAPSKVMNLMMTILIMSALENMNALEHLHQDRFHGQSGNWPLHVTLVTDPSTQLCTGITVGDVAARLPTLW